MNNVLNIKSEKQIFLSLVVSSKDSKEGCVMCWQPHLPISTAVMCIGKGGRFFIRITLHYCHDRGIRPTI